MKLIRKRVYLKNKILRTLYPSRFTKQLGKISLILYGILKIGKYLQIYCGIIKILRSLIN